MTKPRSAVITPLESSVRGMSAHARRVLLCLFTGALGGLLQGIILTRSVAQSILCGVLFGTVFGLLFAKRATSPGAGLIWGLAFAVLLWIVFPVGIVPLVAGAAASGSMLHDTRERFPQ